MKKCQHCKNEISRETTRCPHCGHAVGYQAIKSNNRSDRGVFYVVLAICLIITPMTFTYFLSDSGASSIAPLISNEVADIPREEEVVVGMYESVTEFITNNPDRQQYGQRALDFKQELEGVTPGSLVHFRSCEVYVAQSNNLFFYPVYDITFENGDTMIYALEYDITGKTALMHIEYVQTNLPDFVSSNMDDVSKKIIQDYTTLASSQSIDGQLEEVSALYNQQNGVYELRKDTIGNYGISEQIENDATTIMMKFSGEAPLYRKTTTIETNARNTFYEE